MDLLGCMLNPRATIARVFGVKFSTTACAWARESHGTNTAHPLPLILAPMGVFLFDNNLRVASTCGLRLRVMGSKSLSVSSKLLAEFSPVKSNVSGAIRL